MKGKKRNRMENNRKKGNEEKEILRITGNDSDNYYLSDAESAGGSSKYL